MNPALILRLAPWGIAVLAIGFGVLELANYRGEVGPRAADRAAAQAAILKAQQQPAALSDELVVQHAIAMGTTAKKAGSYVDQIHSAADADRMRVALTASTSLSAPVRWTASVGGAAAAVPMSGAGARS